ncbi:hypothetical protein HS088_TW11G00225 [Tripterygium wilfordii]|uniref:DUF7870 domain-containing protein n=1 Tax=Tripterygium wilfordii TaxID=458696 RepID=A0A7J7D1P6_TRIWF|nr:uncharacterized protein LOC120008965 [Tripterygium wilfordii]KAF5740159.1 hypothetical protein HS088_TW11G00225 [Tripterygium wilfordii]
MGTIHFDEGFQPNCLKKYYKPLYYNGLQFQTDTYLIIQLPDSGALRILARSMILALIFISLPWLGSSTMFAPTFSGSEIATDSINVEFLPLLFRDLTNEGLIQAGSKAVFLSNGDQQNEIYTSGMLDGQDMIHSNVISVNDLGQQNGVPEEFFDIVITSSFHVATEFIDRTLKVGGVAIVQLSKNPSFAFNKPSNYKIVYLRHYSSVILAMKKTSNAQAGSSTHRRLLAYSSEARKAALKNLEDVLLEPPRAASGKSSRYLKKTRYLPDLTGDTLENYPRRVFIDVGLPEKAGGSGTGWFAKNYPTRNLDFEIYKIETVTEESSGKEVPQVAEVGMSDWLRKNVKDEDYVVMKGEAEVVEEMMKSKAITLVDELFMECKPQKNAGRKGTGRAYWECLALYGKLRDEGIAVHQWWG